MRNILTTALLLLPLTSFGASLKELELTKSLEQVATRSNVGTPRVINNDILDKGFSVNANQLTNHLAVIPAHAEQMRADPTAMRAQLQKSVCANPGFTRLMEQGAVLRYRFTELPGETPVLDERFTASDC